MRQQLSEEQLRIRTRLLCILLTVLFLARQHIALRKLPFVAKLVHSLEIKFTAGLPGLRGNLRRNGGERSGKGKRGGEGGREREREKREMRPTSGPPFGQNPGAIVHFSTPSLT